MKCYPRSGLLLAAVFLLFFAAYATADVYNMPAGDTSLQFVTVGNPANPPDPSIVSTPDFFNSAGSVSYAYQISKYDVTNAQYAQFLNAKATGADPLELYKNNIGINYNGNIYTVVPGDENLPVVDVTLYDAVRFINWLSNGQGNGNTESGSYSLLGGTPTPSNWMTAGAGHSAGTPVSLPSYDEWFKAAFYNPATSTYYSYPTSNNSAPNAESPPGITNSANFNNAAGGPTPVGAYTSTTSPYGLFDTGGNVYQWTDDAVLGGSDWVVTGGYYDSDAVALEAPAYVFANPLLGSPNQGFRVVESVPEPSTFILLLCCLVCSGGPMAVRFKARIGRRPKRSERLLR